MRTFIAPETRQKVIDYLRSGSTKQGLIKMLLLIIIAIIIVSVLGFDIRAAIEHPQTQENFSYLAQFMIDLWNNYLQDIWAVIWNIVGPIFSWFWEQMQNFNWTNFSTDLGDFLGRAPELPSPNQ